MRALVIMLLSICVSAPSCIPIIQNVTPNYPVDPALNRPSSDNASILVLPIWNDDGPCNVRSSFVIAASGITTLGDQLDPRHRLGLYDAAGHGPSHFRNISGILLLYSDQKALWLEPGRYPDGNSRDVYWRPRYERDYDPNWAAQLKNWLESKTDQPPAALELGKLIEWCDTYHVKLSAGQRKEATAFIDSVIFAPDVNAFNGWTEFQHGI